MAHYRLRLINHLSAIVLASLALGLILVVLLLNVPLTSSYRPYGDEADARWWFVRITEVPPDRRGPAHTVYPTLASHTAYPLLPSLTVPVLPHYKPFTGRADVASITAILTSFEPTRRADLSARAADEVAPDKRQRGERKGIADGKAVSGFTDRQIEMKRLGGAPGVQLLEPEEKPENEKRGVVMNDDDDDDYPDDNDEDRDDNHPNLNDDNGKNDRYSKMAGRQAYGFGAWGWCEWRREDIFDKGSCVVKAFWQLPRDAPDDRVSTLALPGSIRTSLSIASFFLIFQTILHLLLVIWLLVAFFAAPTTVQNRSDDFRPSDNIPLGIAYHRMLIQPWGFFWAVLLTFAWCLPILIIASIGASKVNADYPGLQADLGLGVIMLCIAILLFLVAVFLPLVGGLRIRRKKK